jgi:hypothetical protein
MTVAYGKQPDGGIALGSLDLLESQRKLEILDITARAVEGMGETERETWSTLPHASFDLVVMNPPFTRPTVHEADRLNVPNPMFAAFTSSAEEQRLMGDATKRLTAGTSAHGNAGEASIFLVLAHRKLKLGGTLGLVMPLSLMSGDSWEESRALLAKNYSDLVFVSIAGAADKDMSFSADTDMGECLVVGHKSRTGSKRATFIILSERPVYPILGASAAKQIHRLIAEGNVRRLEEGPIGGTLLYFGKDVIGQAIDAPLPATGGWNLARIADLSLAQSAYQLINVKRMWLPAMSESAAVNIPITTVAQIGQVGPIHRDINGIESNGDIRGPLDTSPVGSGAPTYPILWAHEASRERTMSFDADCEGIVRPASTPAERASVAAKVARIWETASHCHFNCDFRFNSQSTGMQFTPRKTIGGRAWLSIRLESEEQEKALVLWANTSLGMLLRWWHSNRQQSGRGTIGKSTLQTLPVLDITALNPTQLAKAVALFDAMSGEQLLALHEIDRDLVRKKLDEKFAQNVLGLTASTIKPGGALELLRMKMAREPSIRGAKR